MIRIKPLEQYGAFKILRCVCLGFNSQYQVTLEGVESPIMLHKNHLYRELPDEGKYLICKILTGGLIVSREYVLSEDAIEAEFEKLL